MSPDSARPTPTPGGGRRVVTGVGLGGPRNRAAVIRCPDLHAWGALRPASEEAAPTQGTETHPSPFHGRKAGRASVPGAGTHGLKALGSASDRPRRSH